MKYVYEVHFDEVEDPKEMCLDLIVYLVPSIETIEEMEVWLSINYDIIFQEQLRTSVSHGKHLVENRTFEMFKEWFDYSLHSEVWDTVDDEIVKY